MGEKKKANINVLMLGQSGVGKTTVLSLLYYDLHKKMPFDFEYTCNGQDKAELEEFLTKLRSPITGEAKLTLSSDGYTLDEDVRFDRTADERKYKCTVSRKDGKKLGSITFYDIVGGNVESLNVADEDALEEFKRLFSEADMFILPLNAPAIMEGDSEILEEFNSLKRIGEMLGQIGKEYYCDKPFIFVPIRCEKFSNEFESIIEKVNADIAGFSDKIKGHYSIFPVITLGGLHTSIKKDDLGAPVKKTTNIGNGSGESDSVLLETELLEIVKTRKVKHEYTDELASLIALYWAKEYCDTKFKHKNENIKTYENYSRLEIFKKLKQKGLRKFKEEIWQSLKNDDALAPFISDFATGNEDSHAPSFMEDARNTYYSFKSDTTD